MVSPVGFPSYLTKKNAPLESTNAARDASAMRIFFMWI